MKLRDRRAVLLYLVYVAIGAGSLLSESSAGWSRVAAWGSLLSGLLGIANEIAWAAWIRHLALSQDKAGR